MKRLIGVLLILIMAFSFSAALAQRAESPDGGFSVNLPDHFVEEPVNGYSDLCFYWHGKKLKVQGYASYQGEVAGSNLFQVLTGEETDYGTKVINGMEMMYARTEDDSTVCITYTWMDRGNCVTLEFNYSASDESVQNTVNSIINSIRFDAGH